MPQLDLLCVDLDEEFKASRPHPRLDGGALVAAMSADATSPTASCRATSSTASTARSSWPSADLRAAVADLKDGDPVVVQVERQGQLMLIAFEID